MAGPVRTETDLVMRSSTVLVPARNRTSVKMGPGRAVLASRRPKPCKRGQNNPVGLFWTLAERGGGPREESFVQALQGLDKPGNRLSYPEESRMAEGAGAAIL